MPDNPFAPPPPPAPPDDPPGSAPTSRAETAPPGLAIPTTFRGVANLAQGSGWRLVGWLMATALLVAALLVGSIHFTWGASLSWAAIELPDAGRIEQGVMRDVALAPRILSTSKFLGIVLDPEGLRASGVASDVLVSIEDRGVAIQSVTGWLWLPYPGNLDLPLDRMGMTSLVEAWTAPALLGLWGAMAGALLVSWALLGIVYAPVVLLAMRTFARRRSLPLAWRLATSALLAPALLLAAAVVLYANHQLNVIGLVLAWPTHVVVGWLLALGAVVRLPRADSSNPFAQPPTRSDSPRGPRDPNPFRSP